jgi:hypothetical protein
MSTESVDVAPSIAPFETTSPPLKKGAAPARVRSLCILDSAGDLLFGAATLGVAVKSESPLPPFSKGGNSTGFRGEQSKHVRRKQRKRADMKAASRAHASQRLSRMRPAHIAPVSRPPRPTNAAPPQGSILALLYAGRPPRRTMRAVQPDPEVMCASPFSL